MWTAKREHLTDVDVGFAFLPEYRAKGYAYESAAAVLEYANARLGLDRIVAIVSPENANSIALLEKLGLAFEKMVKLTDDSEEISLYGWERRPA
jgi:RimJ/RimL family protein N-acetyltransferase